MQIAAAPSTGEGCTAPPTQMSQCCASHASRGVCSNLLQALQLCRHSSGTSAVRRMSTEQLPSSNLLPSATLLSACCSILTIRIVEAASACTDIRHGSGPLPTLKSFNCCTSAEASLWACTVPTAACLRQVEARKALPPCLALLNRSNLLVPACRDEFTNFFFLQRKVATLADRQEWRFFAQVKPSAGYAGALQR